VDCAYHFPFGLQIDCDHPHAATSVTLDTDYHTLVQASRHDRLRCCYLDCLEYLKPVRWSVDSNELRCFVTITQGALTAERNRSQELERARDEARRRRLVRLDDVIHAR
jgi:hypothetical protein